MNFKEFDPNIGFDGYYNEIRKILFPNSTPTTVDVAALRLEYRIYPKGSVFSRVRPIEDSLFEKFLNSTVTHKEFFPPTRSVAEASMGRFNIQGERKLYLADHPYIALKECRIEPGQYFLFSYFRFNDDTYFIDATNSETKFSNTLKSLFQSEDKRFYEVINKIYKDYLDYPEFQGIAYNSARVPEKHQHEAWGEIDSITNLAMKEDHIPSADLLVGWLAQCDKNYYPRYFRMFTPNPKKKKLTTTNYHGNKAKFISSYEKTIENIQNIRRKSTLRIKNKEYIDPQINPVKISNKN